MNNINSQPSAEGSTASHTSNPMPDSFFVSLLICISASVILSFFISSFLFSDSCGAGPCLGWISNLFYGTILFFAVLSISEITAFAVFKKHTLLRAAYAGMTCFIISLFFLILLLSLVLRRS